MAWYRREDWDALKRVLVDAQGLHDTYDEWRSSVREVERRMRQEGHLIERVYIEPESFVQWCTLRGLKTDAQARISFATEIARARQLGSD
jgi:hypothetical protein